MKAVLNADEMDAFTSWRRAFHWKPGELKAIKAGFNRRMRRKAKIMLKTSAQFDPKDGPEASYMMPEFQPQDGGATVYAEGITILAAHKWNTWRNQSVFEYGG